MKVKELFIKNKSQFIAFFLVPLISLLFIGSVFGNIFVENIPFGIADLDNSSFSRGIVRQFTIHPGLRIAYYAESEADLESAITSRKVLGGIVIPKGFYRDMLEKKSPKALVLIDGTNMLVGNTLQGYSSAIFGTVSAGLQLNILQGRGMAPAQAKSTLSAFTFIDRVMFEPTLSYQKYLVHLVFLYVVQMVFLSMFLVPHLFAKKESLSRIGLRSREARESAKETVLTIIIAIAVLCVTSFLALLVGGKILHVDSFGSFLEHCALIGIFLVDLTAMGLVFAAITKNLGHFQELYAILSMVFLLSAGIPWPGYMMPKAVSLFVQAFWPLFNVAYPFKALHMKGIGWDLVIPRIGQGLIFAAVWGAIGVALYRRKINSHSQEKQS